MTMAPIIQNFGVPGGEQLSVPLHTTAIECAAPVESRIHVTLDRLLPIFSPAAQKGADLVVLHLEW